jgi:RHS repeat-associated protein
MPTHSRKAVLLATDQQRSVLNALDAGRSHSIAYSPYGYRPQKPDLLSLIGFNGELPDPLTGHYHLGNGYRQFNPVLMRFNSPDSWSPFGAGGLNAYAYCEGDPVNRMELNGHSNILIRLWKGFRNKIGIRIPKKNRTVPPVVNQTQTTTSPLGAPPASSGNTTKIPPDRASNRHPTDSAGAKETRISSSKTQGKVNSPLETMGSSDITKSRLLNRRSKSLGHISESLDESLEAFYASKKYDPDGDFLTTQFAADPTSTQGRLYVAMYSEFSAVPPAHIQRTIRTGGRK